MFGKSGDQVIDRKYIHIYQRLILSLLTAITEGNVTTRLPMSALNADQNPLAFGSWDQRYGLEQSRLCLICTCESL